MSWTVCCCVRRVGGGDFGRIQNPFHLIRLFHNNCGDGIRQTANYAGIVFIEIVDDIVGLRVIFRVDRRGVNVENLTAHDAVVIEPDLAGTRHFGCE